MGCAGSKPVVAAEATSGQKSSSSSSSSPPGGGSNSPHHPSLALTHQRSSSRGIISAEQRKDMMQRASEEDLELPKAVVSAIDVAKGTPPFELDLGQPSHKDGVGLNFPQLTTFPGRIFTVAGLTSLKLKNNRLTALPKDIGNRLPDLITLDVSENLLAELPSSISTMSKLETLDASENLLTSLHSSLGALKALKTLILFKNELTSLPHELGEISSLETCNVFNNKIASIPASFGLLGEMVEFNAGSNKLKSFPPVPAWTKITRIALQWNQLEEIPDFTQCGSTLVQFQINENALTIFPSLGLATKLTFLDIGSNKITEIAGEKMKDLTGLETFTCRKNNLSALPVELFSCCSAIALVDAQQNAITAIPDEVGDAANSLITLLLNKNSIATVPASLRKLTKLQRLGLESNPIDYKNDDSKEVLFDIRDLCIANKGWLRTSGTMLGSRKKKVVVDDATTAPAQEVEAETQGMSVAENGEQSDTAIAPVSADSTNNDDEQIAQPVDGNLGPDSVSSVEGPFSAATEQQEPNHLAVVEEAAAAPPADEVEGNASSSNGEQPGQPIA